uniref:Fibrinogen C-terminal domain-containing protein n=1 Tax=Pseudonaja textilis TaxID=8673 RepID=A0A670Y6J6_PSETE
METWSSVLVLLLLSLARPILSGPEPITGPRCTYTFILPQQKFTGAVCWSSVRPPPEPPGLNRSEVEELHVQMSRQQAQMDELRRLVEVDGAMVSEVKALRKESRNVNARVTQLYTQLLHEILQRRERPVQTSLLEWRVANASAEAARVAASYRQLEGKYNALAALVNNQSALISHLERECQQARTGREVPPQPPLVPVVSHNPASTSNESRGHFDTINDIQRDQTASAQHRSDKAPSPLDDTPLLPAVGPTKSTGEGVHNCQETQLKLCLANGFGNLEGEHWLGLESIHLLTHQGSYMLRVLMEDWSGRQAQAEYNTFALEPESDFYRLQLGKYQGSAGDSLSWHNGRQFTTLDHDHDAYSGNCAHYQKGGWWYNMCAHSNLNGIWYKGGHYRSRYQDGVYWAEFRGGAYSIRKVVMMIRSTQGS